MSKPVTVKATDRSVSSGFEVKQGEWIELEIRGKWRMWDQWNYTGFAGHTNFKKINGLGYLGRLVCRIGKGQPFALEDSYPFQAPATGEVSFWANREGWESLKADGMLTIVIRTGDYLKGKKEKEQLARKEAEGKLLKEPEVGKALDLLNRARRACGLEPVRISVELSDGCRRHARYLVLNKGNPLIAGLKAHEEQKQLKGYSEAGAKAGKAAVISYVPPSQAVDLWLASLYHRIPLLDPSLEEVGIGYAGGKGAWASAIDCRSGISPRRTRDVVFYPEDGQREVLRYFGREIPSPLPAGHSGAAGFPITVYFAAGQQVRKVSATLTGAGGQRVAVYLSTPEAPASSWTQWNSVCLIPQRPLGAGQTYTVSLSCEVSGQPYRRTWRFTTAGKP
jgi:hypothetical protein